MRRIIALVILSSGVAQAAGLLKASGRQDGVSIVSHQVEVTINNGFARTEVDQVFTNSLASPFEAVYQLPLPDQASLSELSLFAKGQEIVGEVVAKQRARQLYEEQKARGEQTALAEKVEHRAFEISVGVLPPGVETRVRFVYYQPLALDHGVGRYVYALSEGGTDEQSAFWSVDNRVSRFTFDLTLKSAFPVQGCRMPNFPDAVSEIVATPNGGSRAEASIRAANAFRLERDIVFYYRLAEEGNAARVEILPTKPNSAADGTFMMVLTPAEDLHPLAESGADYLFVLDISGSMAGGKLDVLTEGVSQALGTMNPQDRFAIVTFNNRARTITPGFVKASEDEARRWIREVRGIEATGGTALFAGLKEAYGALDEDRTTSLILVTDGVANIGETRQAMFERLLRDFDLRLYTFVVGNQANRPLLEDLAELSNGFAMHLSTADDLTGRLLQAKSKALHQALHDVEVSFSGNRVFDLTPDHPRSVYRGEQLVLFGRYRGSGEVTCSIRAKVAGQPQTFVCEATLPEVDTEHPELERLWALSAIEDTAREIRSKGESESRVKRIVDLGTEYSLVTDHTSMLVMDEIRFEEAGVQRENANRVRTEREARIARRTAEARRTTVPASGGNNRSGVPGRAAGLGGGGGGGSGPVGPIVLLTAFLLHWCKRRDHA